MHPVDTYHKRARPYEHFSLVCRAAVYMLDQRHLLVTHFHTQGQRFYYRAMLCIRGTSHGPVSVRLSVRPSQVGVLLKRLNVGSHKQHHTIAQGL